MHIPKLDGGRKLMMTELKLPLKLRYGDWSHGYLALAGLASMDSVNPLSILA